MIKRLEDTKEAPAECCPAVVEPISNGRSCTRITLRPILPVPQPCRRMCESSRYSKMNKDYLAPSTPEHSHAPVGPSNESVSDYFTAHVPTQPVTPMADPVMPYGPKRKPRKLVLCFDGTGNKFRGDDSDSSILKIYRMLDRTADDQCKYPVQPQPVTDFR